MTMPELIVTDSPAPEAQAAIVDGLSAYNLEKAGYRDAKPLAVLVHEEGTVVGGLIGRTSMGLCFIDRFFLPERLRRSGLGSRVITAAEQEALARGCRRAVLWTVHFQAPGFYRKLGYEELGRLEFEPPGHTRFCMTKRLG